MTIRSEEYELEVAASTEGFRIRAAVVDDAPRLCAIYDQYLGTASMDLSSRGAEHYTRLLREEVEAHERVRSSTLVTERRSGTGAGWEIIGWGAVRPYSDRRGYAGACETSIFFDQAHLGRGHGTRLKRRLLAEARALGYHHAVAKLVADNAASIAHNRKVGFEVVGVQKRIGLVQGRYVDVCIMQCELDRQAP